MSLYELRVYHANPDSIAALEARFRDITSKLLDRHGFKIVGYWVAESEPDRFVFIVAHADEQDAKARWDAIRADPEFQAMIQTERTSKLVDRVDSFFMRPTDFSSLT